MTLFVIMNVDFIQIEHYIWINRKEKAELIFSGKNVSISTEVKAFRYLPCDTNDVRVLTILLYGKGHERKKTFFMFLAVT